MYQEILEAIKRYETIIIHRHQRPDPDALGSQLGLASIIRQNFPEKAVYCAGKDEPTLFWMGHMDQVTDDSYHRALVIVCDTANRPRIEDDRYDRGAMLIKIDHHLNEDPYGDICLVDTTASSASELVVDWARACQLSVPKEAAKLLYGGIVGDTGRFLYPSTTPKTFELASFLINFGIDHTQISREMDTSPQTLRRLFAYAYDHLVIDDKGVARLLLTQAVMRDLGVTEAETSAVVSLPGRFTEVAMWVMIIEQSDGSYRLRMRSKTIPINSIAMKHNGGGHPLASGARAADAADLEQIYSEMRDAVDR